MASHPITIPEIFWDANGMTQKWAYLGLAETLGFQTVTIHFPDIGTLFPASRLGKGFNEATVAGILS